MNDIEKKAERFDLINGQPHEGIDRDGNAKAWEPVDLEYVIKETRLAERRELLEWVIAWGQSEMKVYFDDHEYHMSPRYEDALASELIDALKSKLEAK